MKTFRKIRKAVQITKLTLMVIGAKQVAPWIIDHANPLVVHGVNFINTRWGTADIVDTPVCWMIVCGTVAALGAAYYGLGKLKSKTGKSLIDFFV